MPPAWLDRLRPNDSVRFRDARDARRKLEVVEVTERGIWAETSKTAYVTTGTVLRRDPGRGQGKRSARVGVLPPGEQTITLRPDDVLLITRDDAPGRPASHDSAGRLLTPATIGCTVPSVFEQVQAGDPIWFDDGKIGGVVERVDPTAVLVRVTRARPKGARLREDKGINLPESRLEIDALTPKDLEDLTFIAEHADVVELSFANRDRDVELLERELTRLGPRRPGIVLKIETRRGFENLPEMLLAAMRWPCSGVMIARGDLAVETGFERMAEVQEEILWISEAAHVPVIWATQVLETLAREGAPSRAEITDAAMGHRAECVMLNKGPHVLSALRVLDDILRRMATHQTKKRAMLRELHLAHALLDQDEDDLDDDGPEPAARISRSAR
jgi:pyruvate kinase